jgi:hypothetical protein
MIDFKVTVKLNDDDDNKSFEICTHSGTTVEDIVDLIRESLSDSFRRCGTCDVLHPIDHINTNFNQCPWCLVEGLDRN